MSSKYYRVWVGYQWARMTVAVHADSEEQAALIGLNHSLHMYGGGEITEYPDIFHVVEITEDEFQATDQEHRVSQHESECGVHSGLPCDCAPLCTTYHTLSESGWH